MQDMQAILGLYYDYREQIAETSASPSQTGFIEFLKASNEAKTLEMYYTNAVQFETIYRTVVKASGL